MRAHLSHSTHAPLAHSCPFYPLVPSLLRGHEWEKRARVEETHLKGSDERSISLVASNRPHRYGSPVAAKSADGLGGPKCTRRNSAPITIAGAFFVPAISCYGGLRRSTLGCAGLLVRRSANPVQSATLICLAADRGGSSVQGASPMKHALIPSKIRAIAHRRMAMSALRANSSLSVRLKRYNHHMDQARTLEAQGGAQ